MKKLLFAILFTLWSTLALAAWPTKPITLIFPYAPGAMGSQVANALQVEFETKFKVPVIIKYMPGGDHMVALNSVLAEPNDDHTLVMFSDTFYSTQFISKGYAYEKFTPVNIFISYNSYIYGNSNSSVEKLKEDIKNKKPINIGGMGLNSSYDQWLGQLSAPGFNYNYIPYKSGAPIILDVLGGHLEYGIGLINAQKQLIDEGKIKLLAVTGTHRNHVHKEVPTFKEMGLQGDPFSGFAGFITRSDTSPEAVEAMSAALQEVVAKHSLFADYQSQGHQIPNLDYKKSKILINEKLKYLSKTTKSN